MRPYLILAGLLFGTVVGCARGTSTAGRASATPESTRIDRLIAALDTVQGEFQDVADLTFTFVSGSRVLEEIAAYNEGAIPKLVECLGRTQFARATAEYAGPLRVGMLCEQALVYTDYFQARLSSGLWPEWFTDSLPENFATEPEELQRAQRVWRAYLAEHPLGP